MRAAAIRHPGEAVAVALRLVGEAQRIEFFRLRPDVGHVVGEQRIDADHGAGRYRIALEVKVANGASGHRRHWWLQPQRFLERHLGERHRREIVEAGGCRRSQTETGNFVAQLLLPLRMGGQFTYERRQRRGQRIVRRHHQETHVIDDILRREQRAVFMGRMAKLREQVVAAALGAADRNLFGEIGDDALAAPDAARHRCAGERLSDHGDRSRHHVNECIRDVVDFGSDAGAEKGGCREVERELLHRRVEQHRPRLRLPFRNPRRDAGVELPQIGFHWARFERHRQSAAVQPMLFEIEQHQPARKQQAENAAPAERRGELLGLVEQHQLVGIGPEQHEAGLAEQMAAIDQAVFPGLPFDLPLGVGEHFQRLADQRPALVARNMRQRITPRRGEGIDGRSNTLHRHGNCSGFLGSKHYPP